uniref:Uncharacterized protein n=1 Tax=Rhodosorus marinus TaxID=101924 RepID=A0A7S2ZET4_9RHOD|mmetsp:Transcript_17159/g.69494  ORF Transcript_17159/g.69494 Transcript_17159/m.69494 type:complete len:173 (+) Transcript_17159:294-812(+)|eukprot:CAMPEP_0113955348 /NCGR_PEP_ID=MMETSP0011_2-20120614/1268_1 /TAXON_ID=101924 /ORGANISM="Rhodosorus marinus" /LENGTH=172 /DNA_ID=CAMNT_0000964997 /DNA_START=270 /DNA_END=788 /DNA_ORIENTATION=- /assembly_acc=CAM_ASM_000156
MNVDAENLESVAHRSALGVKRGLRTPGRGLRTSGKDLLTPGKNLGAGGSTRRALGDITNTGNRAPRSGAKLERSVAKVPFEIPLDDDEDEIEIVSEAPVTLDDNPLVDLEEIDALLKSFSEAGSNEREKFLPFPQPQRPPMQRVDFRDEPDFSEDVLDFPLPPTEDIHFQIR